MAEDKDIELEKAKAIAAAKAKAAAAAKAKAAAAAKAKAAAAKSEDTGETPVIEGSAEEAPVGDDADAKAKAAAAAKAKAAAAAKAKAAAAAKAKASAGGSGDEPAGVEGDEKAKAIAAAKAKAAAIAAAKAKAAAAGSAMTTDGEAKESKPSKNQPHLDLIVKKITQSLGSDCIEDSYINFLAKEIPTLVIKKEKWFEVATLLREDEELSFDYLSNLHGIDHETHMEVYYNFQSYDTRLLLAVKVKTDRDNGKLPSVTPIWFGANWQEREVYDLLGIEFEGHPDLTRILLPDNWVGYPLRKDYVQYDEEV